MAFVFRYWLAWRFMQVLFRNLKPRVCGANLKEVDLSKQPCYWHACLSAAAIGSSINQSDNQPISSSIMQKFYNMRALQHYLCTGTVWTQLFF